MSTENNRLIAEFMGLDTCTSLACKDNPCYYYGRNCIKAHDLQYHESWDWLMPVIEKIEGMGYDTKIVFSEFMHIMYVHDAEILANTSFTKIESVYNTVIEFINWYNQQIPKI